VDNEEVIESIEIRDVISTHGVRTTIENQAALKRKIGDAIPYNAIR